MINSSKIRKLPVGRWGVSRAEARGAVRPLLERIGTGGSTDFLGAMKLIAEVVRAKGLAEDAAIHAGYASELAAKGSVNLDMNR